MTASARNCVRVVAVAASMAIALLAAPPITTATPAAPRLPVCEGPTLPEAEGSRRVTVSRATGPADYYAVELVPTGRVPGTQRSTGIARVTFEPSPFGVAVAADGSYSYGVQVEVDGLRPREGSDYVAWITTSDLSVIRRVGVLDDSGRIADRVSWNKFLVVITLEAEDAPAAANKWKGPVVLRGMSRSGRMHTMAGHGPFQAEPCVKYGYE